MTRPGRGRRRRFCSVRCRVAAFRVKCRPALLENQTMADSPATDGQRLVRVGGRVGCYLARGCLVDGRLAPQAAVRLRRIEEPVLWCEMDADGTGLVLFVAARDGPSLEAPGMVFIGDGRLVVSTGAFFDLRAALRSSPRRRLWPWLVTRWRRSRMARRSLT